MFVRGVIRAFSLLTLFMFLLFFSSSNFIHVSSIFLISSVGNVKTVSSDLKLVKIIE